MYSFLILKLFLGHADGLHGVEDEPDVLPRGGEPHLHLHVLPRPQSLHRGGGRAEYWLTELSRTVPVGLRDEVERVGQTVDWNGVSGAPFIITLTQST